MSDYEGSRSEFLKLLAEMGEEPAFLARARAPQIALDALLHAVGTQRAELLKWPRFHLSALAQQIGNDWSRLGSWLAETQSAALLAALHASLLASAPVPANWLKSDRAALRDFLKSAARFNRHWRTYIDGLDLEPVNQPRRDFNRFYVVEKACAFGSDGAAEGFEPLAMIDREFLYARFPLLTVPSAA